MTREEAIRHIRDVIAENNSIKPNFTIFEQEKEALYMAIEALQTDAIPLEHHRKVLYKTVDQDIEIARLKNRIKELENG